MRKLTICGVVLACATWACFNLNGAAEPERSTASADKVALAPLQAYVGAWKGVGQPQRGSNKGAWSEQADWAWQFADSHAALVFKAPQGKYFVSGKLSAADKPGAFQLVALRADGMTEDRYEGAVSAQGELILKAINESEEIPARISLRLVADGDRMVTLYERRVPTTDPATERFARIAEVGSTRKGGSFGKGTSFPECVVTGGHADITVEYKGQKYFVCCTGCRDLFNSDPEGVLAEYRERKQKEKEKTEKEKLNN
jgi:YHS domain-containing protein